MRKMTLALLTVVAVLTLGSSAEAAGGCGVGFHRGPAGLCRPNGGPVLGRFYRGHGYWDGHRYWANRYRRHGGWRYR